jgi:hypothetical protein
MDILAMIHVLFLTPIRPAHDLLGIPGLGVGCFSGSLRKTCLGMILEGWTRSCCENKELELVPLQFLLL